MSEGCVWKLCLNNHGRVFFLFQILSFEVWEQMGIKIVANNQIGPVRYFGNVYQMLLNVYALI